MRLVTTAMAIFFLWNSLQADAEPANLESGIRSFSEASALPVVSDVQTARAWIEPELHSALAAKAQEEIEVIVELAVTADQDLSRLESADPGYLQQIERTQATVAHRSRALGAQEISGLSHFPLLHMRLRADKVRRLAGLPHVIAIYANNPLAAARAEGGAIIGAPQLRTQYGAGGRGVGVAVFDTGIDARHSELSDHIVAGADLSGGDDPFVDRQGHGTSVAGIVHSMAPDAHIFSFKVLGDTGEGSEWNIVAGLNVAYANRNSFGGIHVINASLAGGGPINKDCDKGNPANRIINSLFKAGVVMVFSSGNEGFLDGVSAASCHSKVIAVGAVYDADIGPTSFGFCEEDSTRAGQIACYSNSGNPLDVLAPAHNARTTATGGGYTDTFGGTSAAAPYVAGVIAQLRSRLPKATPVKIRSALMSTGTPLRDLNGITRRLIFGPSAYKKLGGK